MSRIFISHASANNAEALALRDWLVARGWDDLFLDIDPLRGLVSGQRWLDRLQESAQRCKAVLFLLSRAWLASRYCTAEFWEARKQERPLFAVVVDDTAVDEVPAEMRGVWQLAFLTRGSRFESFSVLPPPDYAPIEVRFSQEGLESLRLGLSTAGLTSFDTASFPWPARGFEHEANGRVPRRPYRGLKPIDVPDAGVFFGRDADLVRARDRLADLRDRGGRCLVVVLGASGSGKSSFLRAGLLPRLGRDDRRFLPLPVLRPREAPIWGDEGLLALLETAHRQAGLAVTRVALRADLKVGGSRFLRRFADLRAAATQDLPPNAKPPTLILPIDQAEELFVSVRGDRSSETGAAESALFLARLAEILRHGPEVLALVTMRSDAYEPLQTAVALEGVSQIPFNLSPLAIPEYRSVIEGPAARASEAGRPLILEAALTAALLVDAQGVDALSLLGFTMERLYVDHGGDGELTLADYEMLGGVQGSIEAAVAEAFAHPKAEPQIPAGTAEREALLKRAFVPHLMGVNETNGEPVRRTARLADLPGAARNLIDRLVDRRLLVVDRRLLDTGAEDTVIEVAHEALLRRWPTLRRWHDQEHAALTIQQEVARASLAWSQNGHGSDWLAHRGTRLAEAEALTRREDFAQAFEGTPCTYLDACRQSESAARDAEVMRLARQRATQRRIGILLAVVAVVTLAGGWLVVIGRLDLAHQRSQLLVAIADRAFEAGDYDRAVRLALMASQGSWFAPPPADAGLQLGRAAFSSRLEAQLTGHEAEVVSASFSPDGNRIVTASWDHTASVWSRGQDGSWISVVLSGHRGPVTSASFSRDGRLVTASLDHTARVWSHAQDNAWHSIELKGHRGPLYSASFSPDGAGIVTASADGTARVWSQGDDGAWHGVDLKGHIGEVTSASFSPDGTRIVTASADGTARVWSRGDDGAWRSVKLAIFQKVVRLASGEAVISAQEEVRSASFSPDGTHIVTSSSGKVAGVWSRDDHGAWHGIDLIGHDGEVTSVSFSPDGTHIVTASADNTARVWSRGDDGAWQSVELSGHQSWVVSSSFSPNGTQIVTTSDDHTARVWSQGDNGTWRSVALSGHQGLVRSASFSPDGAHIVTASDDHTARVWSGGENGAWHSVELTGHQDEVRSASFSPDDAHIVTASDDHTARVWSRGENGAWHSVVLSGHQDEVRSASFSPDGAHIVTASNDHTARVWSLGDDGAWHSIVLSGHQDEATFSPDGARILSVGNTARVWAQGENGAWHSITLSEHQELVTSASWSPDGTHILTGSWDTARLWSQGQDGAWHSVELLGVQGPVTFTSFSPDGARIITGSFMGTFRVWTQSDNGSWHSVALAGNQSWPSSASFSPDGTLIVTVSQYSVLVWSQGENGVWHSIELSGHQDPVNSASFSPDGAHIVTASADNGVHVWSRDENGDWHRAATLLGHRGPIIEASFSSDGTQIVTASADKSARVWDVHWLMGTVDEAKRRLLPLPETICREKLWGSRVMATDPRPSRNVARFAERLLTAADVHAAPILAGREGEDVCAPFLSPRPWWSKLTFWR